MLRHRLLYGGIFLALVLAVVLWELPRAERVFTSLLLAGIALAALHDFYDMMRRGGRSVLPAAGILAGVALFLVKSPLVPVRTGMEEVLVLCALLVSLAFAGRDLGAERRFEALALTAFGFCYIALPGSFFLDLVETHGRPDGLETFLWTVIVVKTGDAGSYFWGTRFGRHSLSRLSPNKSWEGAAGGLVAGEAMAVGLAAPLLGASRVEIPAVLLVGIVLLVVGQVGDLVESALKRGVEVKDSGRWLPGIGGVLDTVDSLILVAPVAVLLRRILLA